jgi:single-strand DNA-binding protein
MNNTLNLIGHVGQVPEVRTFDSGNKLAKFLLAVTEFGAKDEPKKTMWVVVEAWNSAADRVIANVTKGREVAVSGRLAINTYTVEVGDQKIEQNKPVLRMSGFHLLGAKPKKSTK